MYYPANRSASVSPLQPLLSPEGQWKRIGIGIFRDVEDEDDDEMEHFVAPTVGKPAPEFLDTGPTPQPPPLPPDSAVPNYYYST